MKKLIFSAAIILMGLTATNAQSKEPIYKVQGSEIVRVNGKTGAKAEPVKTNLTHTVKGRTYTVYQGAKGGYFIIRTSKKTGKEYRQYLKTK